MNEGVDKKTRELEAMKNLMAWLSYGQTTIWDGRTRGDGVALLKSAAQQNLLKVDVVYFPDFEQNKSGNIFYQNTYTTKID